MLAACAVCQAAQQLVRVSGYDPPRLLSLLHLAQWRALLAAGGPSTNYSMDAVAGQHAPWNNISLTAQQIRLHRIPQPLPTQAALQLAANCSLSLPH